MNFELDTSRFQENMQRLLGECEAKAWPRTVNKHAFFTALGAIPETPKVEEIKIFGQLSKLVDATRKDGTTGRAPLGYVIAAKRASRHYTPASAFVGPRKQRFNSARTWQSLVGKKFERMLGGRFASAAFIRAGWASILSQLGPLIGGRYNRGDTKVRGAAKGKVRPATSGNLNCVVENTAQSRSDKRLGLVRHGSGPLQRAIDKEANNMAKHLEGEMKGPIEAFNRG